MHEITQLTSGRGKIRSQFCLTWVFPHYLPGLVRQDHESVCLPLRPATGSGQLKHVPPRGLGTKPGKMNLPPEFP